jgi:hypothetical protein
MCIKHSLSALSPTLPSSLLSLSLLQVIYYLSRFCLVWERCPQKRSNAATMLLYIPQKSRKPHIFSNIHYHTPFQALKLSGTNTDPISLVHVSTILLLPMEGNYKIWGSGASNIRISVSDSEKNWSPGWEVKIKDTKQNGDLACLRKKDK